MMDADAYGRFAKEWVASWNSHDPERILSHYAEEVVYRSPFVAQLRGAADGRLVGQSALRPYVRAGLQRYPRLRFVVRGVFAGAGSVVIEYESVDGLLAAETFVLDPSGRACEVFCHYRQGRAGP
jgi:hypothetical protein